MKKKDKYIINNIYELGIYLVIGCSLCNIILSLELSSELKLYLIMVILLLIFIAFNPDKKVIK